VLLAGTVTEKFKILDFRMSAPLVCSVQAHSNVVASIAVDPRGGIFGRYCFTSTLYYLSMHPGSDFITASLDGTARVWDIGSARCFKSFLSANFAPM
jgi:WD40 repeat protein